MAEEKPIIILKKKGGHGGHHGGAWKVAYADFVTAMMCFFMVMWLVNSAEAPTRKNIASYFRRPGIFQIGSGTPLLLGGAGILTDGIPPATKKDRTFTSGGSQAVMKKDQKDLKLEEESEDEGNISEETELESPTGKKKFMMVPEIKATIPSDVKLTKDGKLQLVVKQAEAAAQAIRKQIAASKELRELLGVVDVKLDGDGLNIEIMDTERASMFESGKAEISEAAQSAFEKLGAILAKLPNTIDIIGHTDSKAFPAQYRGGYSNWELSADRANAARRLLVASGIVPERITSVLGRADRELKVPSDPMAAANRRITLKMRFLPEDLNVDPEELEELPEPPLVAPTPEPGQESAFNARELLVEQKKKSLTVALPDETPLQENPGYMQRDKIFSDHPVMGPAGPFANF